MFITAIQAGHHTGIIRNTQSGLTNLMPITDLKNITTTKSNQ